MIFTATTCGTDINRRRCRRLHETTRPIPMAGAGGLLHALMKRTKGVELEERLFSLGSVTSPAAKGLQKLEEAKRRASGGGGSGSASTPKSSKDKKGSGKGGGGGSKSSKKDSARKKKKS
ncbi:unnamed protein product [Laminaria digitata]